MGPAQALCGWQSKPALQTALGYRKGADGLPEIIEEEALIVRLIYRLFLYGKSPSAIATYLTDEGIPTPSGKAVWRASVVESNFDE
ncbi:MAG: recombinase family protein [Candidatus Merdivicinus sp.]